VVQAIVKEILLQSDANAFGWAAETATGVLVCAVETEHTIIKKQQKIEDRTPKKFWIFLRRILHLPVQIDPVPDTSSGLKS